MSKAEKEAFRFYRVPHFALECSARALAVLSNPHKSTLLIVRDTYTRLHSPPTQISLHAANSSVFLYVALRRCVINPTSTSSYNTVAPL